MRSIKNLSLNSSDCISSNARPSVKGRRIHITRGCRAAGNIQCFKEKRLHVSSKYKSSWINSFFWSRADIHQAETGDYFHNGLILFVISGFDCKILLCLNFTWTKGKCVASIFQIYTTTKNNQLLIYDLMTKEASANVFFQLRIYLTAISLIFNISRWFWWLKLRIISIMHHRTFLSSKATVALE